MTGRKCNNGEIPMRCCAALRDDFGAKSVSAGRQGLHHGRCADRRRGGDCHEREDCGRWPSVVDYGSGRIPAAECEGSYAGLVDAHTAVGLTGYLNTAADQDELESSAPMQPELRAVDAYDPRERLIEWVRSFGVTTMNTGHASGALISGQLMIVKTRGNTVEEATMKPVSMVAASLGELGRARGEGKSPGTRAKEMAMLREQFVKAQEYLKKMEKPAGTARRTRKKRR